MVVSANVADELSHSPSSLLLAMEAGRRCEFCLNKSLGPTVVPQSTSSPPTPFADSGSSVPDVFAQRPAGFHQSVHTHARPALDFCCLVQASATHSSSPASRQTPAVAVQPRAGGLAEALALTPAGKGTSSHLVGSRVIQSGSSVLPRGRGSPTAEWGKSHGHKWERVAMWFSVKSKRLKSFASCNQICFKSQKRQGGQVQIQARTRVLSVST